MSDLISREDVIRELKDCPHCYNNWIEIKSIIEYIPSAEPKREECEEREQGLCPFYAG